MKSLSLVRIVAIVTLFCAASAIVGQAQTYNVLFKLNGSNGYGAGSLTQGRDGNLYGTTPEGGIDTGSGTVFRIAPTGQFTSLYKFCSLPQCADGWYPGSLVLGVNGDFYGATGEGGTGNPNGCGPTDTCGGTFFQITPRGQLTTLYDFCSSSDPQCSNGSNPAGQPVLGYDGKYYGTAHAGGNTACFAGCGTVYDITTTGTLNTFYQFQGGQLGEAGPDGLVLANNGNFYGLQLNDGEPIEPGLIFKLTRKAQISTLYQFRDGLDGFEPQLLIQASDGNFYGTASQGANGAGTLFKVTPSGEFTTLYSFCSQTNCADGGQPNSLIEGSDGNFYGVAAFGGNPAQACYPYSGCGTIFKITPTGDYSVLYTFCSQTNCADGVWPGGLMQATDGTFYGGTSAGMTRGTCYLNEGCGGIFSLSVGLGPFVNANPTFGAVGHIVNILGNKLTGTTSVKFNGAVAKFKVVSDTYLKAQVPTGTTTGKIEVTTPSGTLMSNVGFQVLP